MKNKSPCSLDYHHSYHHHLAHYHRHHLQHHFRTQHHQHRQLHQHHQRLHIQQQHRRYLSTSVTTCSVTPSTIQCTEFNSGHPTVKAFPSLWSSPSSKSSKSSKSSAKTTTVSITTAPSSLSSEFSSTAQLHRQFKATKKKTSLKSSHYQQHYHQKAELDTITNTKITPSSSFSSDHHQPTLLNRSAWTDPCLDQWVANNLQMWLPPRVASSSKWNLIYSLDQHGCSIRTLYDRVGHYPPGPNLLILRTDDEEVFGAYISEALKTEQQYYGSGECFLWKTDCKHQVQVYPWTGANDHMVFSNQDFIAFGGDDGRIGLFIHADLQNGHTQPCCTFNNDKLANQHQFEIIGMEIWGFDY